VADSRSGHECARSANQGEMTMAEFTPGTAITVCGRWFTPEELQVIRTIIARNFQTSRTRISQEVCRALAWYKPDGGLKDMSCRVALLRLHRAGIVELPPPRQAHNNGRRCIKATAKTDPGPPVTQSVQELVPIELIRVTRRAQSALWNELIHRYHYLGYTPLPGHKCVI